MGAKYTTTAISGWNSSPPPDDGSQGASNLIKWSGIKDKLSTPVKDAIESINTKLVTALDTSVTQIFSGETLGADDHLTTVEIAPSVSTIVTVTLADAATVTNIYRVYIKNSGSKACTIARTTSGDTIDGAAADVTMPPKSCIEVTTNDAADGYLIVSSYQYRTLPAGIGPLPYSGSTIPTGFLECDGSAISRTTHPDLFAAIGTTWGAGDGSSTFNLPNSAGRTIIGDGTGTVTASGVDADVNTTDDTLAVAENDTKWITGMAVVFNLTSGTITGLTDDTTYYVVRNSSTTIKLATTLANAQNGTVIDFTAKSSPVWDITHTFTARTLGEYGGEEAHAQSIEELLAHVHPIGSTFGAVGAGGAHFARGSSLYNSSSTGGNAAMNIMGPFLVTKFIISY